MSHVTKGTRKVAVIGAGAVGSSVAYALTVRDAVREVVLIDMDENRVLGEAEDIRHGLGDFGTANVKAGTYEDIRDCEIIVITAGRGRRPGESRLDLAKGNVAILRNVIDSMKPYYTGSIVIVVANPVDIMTLKACEWLDKKDGTVFGTGCLLDSSRFVRLIADHTGLDPNLIHGNIVGEHGDSQVPVWSLVTAAGMPVEDYCKKYGIAWNEEIRSDIAERTKKMGGHIISLKGKTHYGIAASVCYLAESILNGKTVIASVSSYFHGEKDVDGIALSMPSVITKDGVRDKIKEYWTEEEFHQFIHSAETLRNTLNCLEES